MLGFSVAADAFGTGKLEVRESVISGAEARISVVFNGTAGSRAPSQSF
jgi:hypothetical protein